INQPLVPASATPGGADFTITVNGAGFVSSSVVNWNGGALATTSVSSSQVTAIVPASDIATAGTVSVAVVNPAPGGGTSNVDFFDVRQPFLELGFGFSKSPTSVGPYSPFTVDLNGDGKLDVINLTGDGQNSAAVTVLLGNGNGTFQQP